MAKLSGKRSAKVGLPPGTAFYIGEAAAETRLSVFDFDEADVREKTACPLGECLPFKDAETVTWINIDGLRDISFLEEVGEMFGLHPLVIEDIVSTDQRPKIESYDDYLFMVVKMLRYDAERNEVDVEQVSVVLGPNYVLSFQERPGDVFDPVRERIRTGKGRVRQMKADYLAYALFDAIVDNYFVVLEHLSSRVEIIEDQVVSDPEPVLLKMIHELRQEVATVKKAVWPLREVVNSVLRDEVRLFKKSTQPYLRDLYDHTVQTIDAVETFRDLLASTRDTYLSSISNRMNEVMKVLTLIATIFIPLTFVAGIYGMNFENMPELKWQYGYFGVLALMVAVAIAMVIYFRKRHWL